jgi:hypothetical protein
LPLDQTREVQCVRAIEITLATASTGFVTKNVKHRGQKFLNNELRSVVSIDGGKIIFDEGEIVGNGTALQM